MNDIIKVDGTINVISEQEILNHKFNIYGTFIEPYFLAKDVASWLSLTNVSDMISRVDDKFKFKFDMGGLIGICNFVTIDGLSQILSSQIKQPQYIIDIIKNKIEKFTNKKICVYTRFIKEPEFYNILNKQLTIFGIKIKRQYKICNYHIDFYIPSLNIAIEYDEHQHFNKKNKIKDKDRQNIIENKIGCKFIRVSYKKSNIENSAIVLKKILEYKNIKLN